jgi:hypothetical protein
MAYCVAYCIACFVTLPRGLGGRQEGQVGIQARRAEWREARGGGCIRCIQLSNTLQAPGFNPPNLKFCTNLISWFKDLLPNST